MKLNELIDKIKDFEGFRVNAYYDSGGTVTIGYGRTGGVSITDKTISNYIKYLCNYAHRYFINTCVWQRCTNLNTLLCRR